MCSVSVRLKTSTVFVPWHTSGVFKSFPVFKQQLSDLCFATYCGRIRFKEFLWTSILGRFSVDNANLVICVLL